LVLELMSLPSLSFSSKLFDLGKDIFEEADMTESDMGAADPKVNRLQQREHRSAAFFRLQQNLVVRLPEYVRPIPL
jgi:hypothetical protein